MFARGANASVERPIQRKSKTYVETEVLCGRAFWVDETDHRKGIVCREMLYFGERKVRPEPLSEPFPAMELPGIRLERARSCDGQSMAHVALGWAWTPLDAVWKRPAAVVRIPA